MTTIEDAARRTRTRGRETTTTTTITTARPKTRWTRATTATRTKTKSESESEDDDYDEDVGKTKKRGKTGRTTRASGGAVVVVPTTTGRGERGVKVASVNADDALRAQLSGKQDPMAFVISSSVPETGEVLKFTSLLHNARDGRTYAAAFGDARRGAGRGRRVQGDESKIRHGTTRRRRGGERERRRLR